MKRTDNYFQVEESKVNAYNTALGAGETLTGIFESNQYPDVGVSVQMDTDGILYFDFSPDGIHVNTFPVNGFSITAGIHEFHTAVKLGRQFRLRIINSGGAQTYCRAYTYYGVFRQGNLPLGSNVNDDSDCLLVRNPYDDVDIARGKIQSVSKFSKFGEASISTSLVPITTTTSYPTPTTAQTLEIVSDDAKDTGAGDGARTVIVIGLDSTWSEVSEEVTLAGLTPVVLTQTFIRVYRMYVNTSGTYASQSVGSHQGTITLRISGGGANWAQIPFIHGFGVGQSLIGAYTVPLGKVFYMQTLTLSSDTTKTVSAILFRRDNADDIVASYSSMRAVRTFDGIDNVISIPVQGISVFPAKTDLGVLAITSAGSADVTVEFSGYLIDE